MHRRNRRAAAIIPDRGSWIAGKLGMQLSRESGCVEADGGIGVDCVEKLSVEFFKLIFRQD
jgi:hypothetical protein